MLLTAPIDRTSLSDDVQLQCGPVRPSRPCGSQPTHTSDGECSIELAQTTTEAILMSIVMPVMAGWRR